MKKASKKTKPVTVPSRASMETISFLTGHPKDLLRLAKKWGLPGFCSNGSVQWKKLRPHFFRRLDELKAALPHDSIGFDAEIQKCNLRLRELEILKLEGKMLAPEDVKQILRWWASALSVTIKTEMAALPPRITGQSAENIQKEFDKMLAAVEAVNRAALARLDELTKVND
jgi:hypothetical protein